MPVSPEQCRAARGLLKWTRHDLARAAGISSATVYEFEAGRRETLVAIRNAIQTALEAADVGFPLPSDGRGSITFPSSETGS